MSAITRRKMTGLMVSVIGVGVMEKALGRWTTGHWATSRRNPAEREAVVYLYGRVSADVSEQANGHLTPEEFERKIDFELGKLKADMMAYARPKLEGREPWEV